MGDEITYQRHKLKLDAEAQKRQEHMNAIKAQIVQNKQDAAKKRQDDMDYHLNNLKLQEQMFRNRQQQLDDRQYAILNRDDSMYQHFCKPEMITQAKLEVEKDKRADRMAARYLSVNNQREKERDDELNFRREVARKEADEINSATLAQHRA